MCQSRIPVNSRAAVFTCVIFIKERLVLPRRSCFNGTPGNAHCGETLFRLFRNCLYDLAQMKGLDAVVRTSSSLQHGCAHGILQVIAALFHDHSVSKLTRLVSHLASRVESHETRFLTLQVFNFSL